MCDIVGDPGVGELGKKLVGIQATAICEILNEAVKTKESIEALMGPLTIITGKRLSDLFTLPSD